MQSLSNVLSEEEGRRCDCGKVMPHEHLEIFDAEGQLIEVKRVQTSGMSVRVYLDCLKPVQKVMN